MEAVVILNPSAGRGTSPAEATSRLAAAGLVAEVRPTSRAGEAAALAREAVAAGAGLLVAWGGDGTIHETASALVGTAADIGIVPAGSGNGLARGLGLSLDPDAALRDIAAGATLRIDVGEIAGRPFFNVAGAGLDAWVAARTQEVRLAGRRGLQPYMTGTLRGLAAVEPWPIVLETADTTIETSVLLVVFANGPQYGHAARIAPGARLDDGLLDIVVVEGRSAPAALWLARRLFTGSLALGRGVRVLRAAEARLRCAAVPGIPLHRDGEADAAAQDVRVRVRPASLRVRVPAL